MAQDVRAVFFDAGYTLLCMEPDQKTNFLQACTDLGIDIDQNRLAGGIARANVLLGPRHPEAAAQRFSIELVDQFWIEYNRVLLSACAVDPADAARAETVYRRFLERLGWRVYDEVRPLLLALRARGIMLGVISNWTGDLEEVLRSVQLRDAFDFVLDSAHLGFEKPHPQIFHEALRRAGSAAQHALHVGDSPEHDVEGALAAGLRAALLDRDERFADFDRAPRLTNLKQLLALLDSA
jgi:putative hydrolase of the HAD superfamily